MLGAKGFKSFTFSSSKHCAHELSDVSYEVNYHLLMVSKDIQLFDMQFIEFFVIGYV